MGNGERMFAKRFLRTDSKKKRSGDKKEDRGIGKGTIVHSRQNKKIWEQRSSPVLRHNSKKEKKRHTQ